MIILKSENELINMRKAGKVVADTLELMREVVKPGIMTHELDRIAEQFIIKCGAIPAFKGYNGFPANICTSINSEVVHGIPGKRVLEEGNIISIDIGAIIDGYYGDAAVTYPVGKISVDALKLIQVTERSFYEGLKYARSDCRLSDISHAIQIYVEAHGFSVIRNYVGHGIGQEMHEDPQVPNYGKPGKGPRLKPGMALAIEPMVNAGSYDVATLQNGWTVVTADGSLSSHYENTIAITDGEPIILTMV